MDDVAYNAALLLERMIRDSYREKRSSAIQPLQWSILRRLCREHPNTPDITSLARYLDLTLPPVSRAVATLEKRGLVEKSAKHDRRSVALSPTAKGFAALLNDPLRHIATNISGLSPADADHFITCVRDMVVNDTL
jgi:DNA-binding MarR family transcriptional regulator